MPEATIDDIQSLLEKQNRAFDEFKSANDARLKEIEKKGVADVVTDEKVDRINKRIGDLQDAIDTANRKMSDKLSEIEKKAARPGAGGEMDQKAIEQKEAFLHALRKGISGNGSVTFDTKDSTVANDATGGYYVAPDFVTRIVERIFETTPMRQYATTMNTSTDSIEFLNNAADIAAGWVGETQTRTQTQSLQPGKIRIPVNEVYASPQLSQKLLDDAMFDVESYLTGKIADKIGRLENNAYINGSGVGQPRGILSYAASATSQDDSVRAWGALQYIATGAANAFAGANPADILFDVVYALKTDLQDGAKWMMPRAVADAIRKFKANTTQNYLWQPALMAGQPSQLLGYDVVIAQDIPVIVSGGALTFTGSTKIGAIFGNFREGYTIVDRLGLRILRDPYTVAPEVKFYTTKRTGGDVVNSEAIKLLSFTAS